MGKNKEYDKVKTDGGDIRKNFTGKNIGLSKEKEGGESENHEVKEKTPKNRSME